MQMATQAQVLRYFQSDAALYRWMNSESPADADYGMVIKRWGGRLTPDYLKSSLLGQASIFPDPVEYEDRDLAKELGMLLRGRILWEDLEMLYISIYQSRSWNQLKGKRLIPATLGVLQEYSQSNNVRVCLTSLKDAD
jgi:hypothetical protein